jgi:hypothetical protein
MTDAIPDLIKPLLEQMFNTGFFNGRPIVPVYLQGMVPERQYDQYTSDNSIMISKSLKELGINVSPMVVDNYLRGYLISGADVLKSVTNNLNDAFGVSQNEFRKQYDLMTLPIISGFARDMYDPSSEYQVSKFTDTYKSLKSVYDTFNSLKKIEPQKSMEFFNEHSQELMAFPSVSAQYDSMKYMISGYRTILKSKNIPRETRDARLKHLKDLIITNALRVNDVIETNLNL